MRSSTAFRYWLARLKPLLNPLTLIPVTVIVLMVVLIVEYGKNPGASQWEGIGADATDQQGDSAEAQFDTLGRLLNEPQLGDGGGDAAQEVMAGQADPASAEVGDGEPFSAYLDEYRFGGRAGQANVSVPSPSQSTRLASPTSSRRTASAVPQRGELSAAAATGESALSLAIGRLQGQPAANSIDASRNAPTASEASGTASSATASIDGAVPASELPNLPTSQSGVVRGSLPGADIPFIRTTPNMSPPPGTTGYTPPASLDLSIYNNTLNRRPLFDAPNSGVPAVNLQQPIPGSSNNVLPTPSAATVPAAPAVPQPATANSELFDNPPSAYESFWGN